MRTPALAAPNEIASGRHRHVDAAAHPWPARWPVSRFVLVMTDARRVKD